MDSDEDLPISFESPPSPLPSRKLKRLKKSAGIIHESVVSQPADLETVDDFEEIGEVSDEELAGEGLQADIEGLGEEDGSGSEKEDPLEVDSPGEGTGGGSKDPVEEEVEVPGLDKGGGGLEEMEDESGGKSEKDEEEDEGGKKSKKRRSKKSEVDAPPKKKADKGRKQRMKELRAESQRLLRETRDASFKPMPIVQKSVSSVLEKIRQRKREISMMSMDSMRSIFDDSADGYSSEVSLEFDAANSPTENVKESKAIVEDEQAVAMAAPSKASSDTPEGSRENKTAMVADEELKQKTTPTDETEDLDLDSQTSDSMEQPDETPDHLEEVFPPSSLAMKLKLGSDSPDDSSSDEEDNDKENIAPRKRKPSDRPQSPNGNFAKTFLDEEAEEEDDSDNDRGRFQDDEEEEDEIDSGEFDDLIATAYEEKPVDKEMRDQLHQKWLEQQDATTENLLQKFKYGSKHREATPLEEEQDEENEEYSEDFLDDAAEYQGTKKKMRMNLQIAKEMIIKMFTDDEDDKYISSDDEETERNHIKSRLSYITSNANQNSQLEQEEHTNRSSTTKDASNSDIAGRIKKLNGVQDAKKKAKITSSFDMLSIGGIKTAPVKSSFIGFGRNNSLPSLKKQGSGAGCSFVFERDDSNSRSAISVSEYSPDWKESTARKAGSAKFSASQQKSSTQNSQNATITKSGPSLHEILRRPASDVSRENSMVGQVEAIYASFKLDRNVLRKQTSVSNP